MNDRLSQAAPNGNETPSANNLLNELQDEMTGGKRDFGQAVAEVVEKTPDSAVPGVLAELAIRRLDDDKQFRHDAIIAAHKARFHRRLQEAMRHNPLGLGPIGVVIKEETRRRLGR
ncbi:MAG: hypothetical protein EOT04_01995 [Candidatus Chaera renei]|uniref:Uncharacterized protein n=1 Tax=Candidatus Chaera renei TaxID=2506947 RepID=A0A4Q0AK74_9BACT|nr:MAG: hypothetical protein EOT04_01995 [Candidatus Chaera renei]